MLDVTNVNLNKGPQGLLNCLWNLLFDQEVNYNASLGSSDLEMNFPSFFSGTWRRSSGGRAWWTWQSKVLASCINNRRRLPILPHRETSLSFHTILHGKYDHCCFIVYNCQPLAASSCEQGLISTEVDLYSAIRVNVIFGYHTNNHRAGTVAHSYIWNWAFLKVYDMWYNKSFKAKILSAVCICAYMYIQIIVSCIQDTFSRLIQRKAYNSIIIFYYMKTMVPASTSSLWWIIRKCIKTSK